MGAVYLTEDDVRALAPAPAEMADALERVFRLRHAGRISMPPKSRLACEGSDAFFQAMAAAVPGIGAGVKWVGGSPGNSARSLPTVDALLVLSDLETGRPTGVIEAAWLTALRTAAMSLVAARRLARPGARTLALIGTGVQARAHLAALRTAFPLATVRICGRSPASVEALAGEAAAAGLTPQPVSEPAEALRDADIVVSTIPDQPGLKPFLDAALLPPGAMAAMVDRGRSWTPDSLRAFDRSYTDDLEQGSALAVEDPVLGAMRFTADLAALASDAAPGRLRAGERLAFAFPGCAFADVAVGALILARARERG